MLLICIKILITLLFIATAIRWYYKDEKYEDIPTVLAWTWTACIGLSVVNFMFIVWTFE